MHTVCLILGCLPMRRGTQCMHWWGRDGLAWPTMNMYVGGPLRSPVLMAEEGFFSCIECGRMAVAMTEAICCGVVPLKSLGVLAQYVVDGCGIGSATIVLAAPCSMIGGLKWDGTCNIGFPCGCFDILFQSTQAFVGAGPSFGSVRQ